MPLFVCDDCHSIENTALGAGGWSFSTVDGKHLCSACMPEGRKGWMVDGDGWHGRFERRRATPEIIEERIDEFLHVPDELMPEDHD